LLTVSSGAFIATLLITLGAIAVGYLIGFAFLRNSQARPATQASQEITAEDLRRLEAEAEGIKCEYCGGVMSGSGKR
jgi:hypothetical protein